jgi:hypothetical protein
MTHVIPMPDRPVRAVSCRCGFLVLPTPTWADWEQIVAEHLDQVLPAIGARDGHAVEICQHHGLTEFRIKFRNNRRQRNCLACARERDRARLTCGNG